MRDMFISKLLKVITNQINNGSFYHTDGYHASFIKEELTAIDTITLKRFESCILFEYKTEHGLKRIYRLLSNSSTVLIFENMIREINQVFDLYTVASHCRFPLATELPLEISIEYFGPTDISPSIRFINTVPWQPAEHTYG